MSKSALAGVLAGVGLLVCVSCSDSESSGASASAEPVALFNPCTEIPDETLVRAGVDPATEEKDIAGVHQTGWEICSWKGPWYFVQVFSTEHTVEEIRRKPENTGFRPVTVAGRDGLEVRKTPDPRDENCDVLFEAEQGSITVNVLKMSIKPNPEDPCTTAMLAAEVLAPLFPK